MHGFIHMLDMKFLADNAEKLVPYAIEDSLRARAYETLGASERAELKLSIARLYTLWGRRDYTEKRVREFVDFSVHEKSVPCPYAIICCQTAQLRGVELIPALLPALMAGVRDVIPWFICDKGASTDKNTEMTPENAADIVPEDVAGTVSDAAPSTMLNNMPNMLPKTVSGTRRGGVAANMAESDDVPGGASDTEPASDVQKTAAAGSRPASSSRPAGAMPTGAVASDDRVSGEIVAGEISPSPIPYDVLLALELLGIEEAFSSSAQELAKLLQHAIPLSYEGRLVCLGEWPGRDALVLSLAMKQGVPMQYLAKGEKVYPSLTPQWYCNHSINFLP